MDSNQQEFEFSHLLIRNKNSSHTIDDGIPQTQRKEQQLEKKVINEILSQICLKALLLIFDNKMMISKELT